MTRLEHTALATVCYSPQGSLSRLSRPFTLQGLRAGCTTPDNDHRQTVCDRTHERCQQARCRAGPRNDCQPDRACGADFMDSIASPADIGISSPLVLSVVSHTPQISAVESRIRFSMVPSAVTRMDFSGYGNPSEQHNITGQNSGGVPMHDSDRCGELNLFLANDSGYAVQAVNQIT